MSREWFHPKQPPVSNLLEPEGPVALKIILKGFRNSWSNFRSVDKIYTEHWMSRWKLVSMVSKWVLSPTYKRGIWGLWPAYQPFTNSWDIQETLEIHHKHPCNLDFFHPIPNSFGRSPQHIRNDPFSLWITVWRAKCKIRALGRLEILASSWDGHVLFILVPIANLSLGKNPKD